MIFLESPAAQLVCSNHLAIQFLSGTLVTQGRSGSLYPESKSNESVVVDTGGCGMILPFESVGIRWNPLESVGIRLESYTQGGSFCPPSLEAQESIQNVNWGGTPAIIKSSI